MEASSISNDLFAHLNYRAERQKVISSNISNINTPNYKTKDLVFQEELNKNQATLKMASTNNNHLGNINSAKTDVFSPKLVNVQGLEEQNDGNNVNLDTQISEMSKNKVLFDAIQAAIKKDSRLFRNVVESSAKN